MLGLIGKMSDATRTFLAMILGVLAGLLIGEPMVELGFIGDIWLNMLKMFLIPIILTMLLKSITGMESMDSFRRIGIRFGLYYISTTVLAATIGLILVTLLGTGRYISIAGMEEAGAVSSEVPTVAGAIEGFFAENVFQAFSEGNTSQVIVISIITGIAILRLPEEKKRPVVKGIRCAADIVGSIVHIVIKLSPIGVFFLMASGISSYGASLLVGMAGLLLTCYLACAIHLILVQCLSVWVVNRINPLEFIKKAFPTIAIASSTCSSSAVIPVNMEVAKTEFGTDDSVTGLGISLGATINKNGTAIMCAVVSGFSLQVFGIELTPFYFLSIIGMTTLFTCGTAGLPGGGIVNLTMVSQSLGIPLDIAMLVAGFYRFFDMVITPINCIGQLATTVNIGRIEKNREKSRDIC